MLTASSPRASRLFDSQGNLTGTTGGANIDVTLMPGASVQGGVAGMNNAGAGIRLLDGNDNSIAIGAGATVTSSAKYAGFAVQGAAETKRSPLAAPRSEASISAPASIPWR